MIQVCTKSGVMVWFNVIAPFSLFWIAVTSQVTLSPPPGDVCYGDVVELTCQTTRDPSQYDTPQSMWMENMRFLNLSRGFPYSLQSVNTTDDRLTINITREYFQENMVYSYQCYYVFKNFSTDESGVVKIDPLDHPNPPTWREAVTTTTSTATLKVDHRKTCFQECTFHYEVRVHPADSPTLTSTSNHSTDVLSVSGLTGDTMYSAEVVAVCVGESTIRSDPLTVTFTTREDGTPETPTSPPANGTTTPVPTGLVAGVVVICVVVVLVLIGVVVVVLVMVFRRKSGSPQPPKEEVSREAVSYQTVQYADLYFTKNPPIRPPALETTVQYSEAVVGAGTAQIRETPPPEIPVKKGRKKDGGGIFAKDVLAIMDGSGILFLANSGTCLRNDCSRRKCDHKRLKSFRADLMAVYKDVTFVANCLEDPDRDVSKEDVKEIIVAKKGLEATKGFLICNQEFMSMDLLVHLEENDCFFVSASGHGKESWDKTFLEKFASFFT